MSSIKCNDILDELMAENKRLLNELIFAKKWQKIFNELKEFLEKNKALVEENTELKTIFIKINNNFVINEETVTREEDNHINDGIHCTINHTIIANKSQHISQHNHTKDVMKRKPK